MTIRDLLVFCASSRSCAPAYHDAAARLGRAAAQAGVGLVYGGGAHGSMGALADAALAAGGRVRGVLPHFMRELEWGHEGIDALDLVDDMRERKRRMLDAADAVAALPGGSGTFEELFEALSFKRLGLFAGPIVLVNTRGFFDPCLTLLDRCVEESFMAPAHREMWCVVDEPEQVLDAIAAAPAWDTSARAFAVS